MDVWRPLMTILRILDASTGVVKMGELCGTEFVSCQAGTLLGCYTYISIANSFEEYRRVRRVLSAFGARRIGASVKCFFHYIVFKIEAQRLSGQPNNVLIKPLSSQVTYCLHVKSVCSKTGHVKAI